jgi:DNA-binding NarL/FixJ family response regulator
MKLPERENDASENANGRVHVSLCIDDDVFRVGLLSMLARFVDVVPTGNFGRRLTVGIDSFPSGSAALEIAITIVRSPNVLQPFIEQNCPVNFDGVVALIEGDGDLDCLVRPSLERGSLGLLSRDSPIEELAQAIETVAIGGVFIAPRLIELNSASACRADVDDSLLVSFTERELEVLGLLKVGSPISG